MARLGIGFIFKTSFDKANRLAGSSPARHGPGKIAPHLRRGEREIRRADASPTCTKRRSARRVAEIIDVLQIPAFLCRQTDLLVAAAKTMRPINIKKGQFLAPWDMKPPDGKGDGRRQPERHPVRARRHVRLQHAGLRHARAAHHGGLRRAGDVRRDAFGAAAGRAGQPFAAASANSCPRWRAPRSRWASRVCSWKRIRTRTRRSRDGPNMIRLKDLPALLAELKEIDAIAKRRAAPPT